jgi:hypothetical protein
MTRSLLAAALAGGLMMTLTVPQPAAAIPVAKAPVQTSGGVMLARHGGGGGGGGMHMHGGGGGGGGSMHMRSGGGGVRAFRGGNFARSGPRFRDSYNGHSGGRGYGHARGRGRGYGFYPGYYYGGYDYGYADSYYYSDECAWLRRRALATGSRYWWRRYALCREDY